MKRAAIDRRRSLILGFFCLLWFALLSLRLVQLQVLEHTQHKETVLKQNQEVVDILPKRGTIFDRNGRILAMSTPAQHIAYRTQEDDTRQSLRAKMNRMRALLPAAYSISRAEEEYVWNRIRDGHHFSRIKRQVPYDVAWQVRSAGIAGIDFEDSPKRVYPKNTLAGHLLGRISLDGKGQAGIELSYDAVLGGVAGRSLDLQDGIQRSFQRVILKPPVPGKDVYLTIDENIQHFASRRLAQAYAETGAERATMIISDPSSGEILAMVNYPPCDPNRKLQNDRERQRADSNGAIRDVFEHGSTMKIATFAAALESGAFTMDQTFDCSDGKRFFGRKSITDHKKLGTLSFAEIFIHSSNVGTTFIADEVGEDSLYEMVTRMGFSRRTGIGLPGEESFRVKPPEEWEGMYQYAWFSIGYGFSATALQVLQMTNIVANRGMHIPFRIVKDIPEDPSALPDRAAPYKRVLDQHTADQLRWLMTEVVRRGTGVPAQLDGFQAAGKTGTAQKYLPGKGYSRDAHIGSFVGFVPADDPVISMIVVIDNPQRKFYGAEVAAPVFRDIAERVLLYLRVRRDPGLKRTLLTADSRRETR